MSFSAVIVTRGNVDLGAVLAPIVPVADEIIIRRGHAGVWERWEAILGAKHELVYTQDDDAIVDLPRFMLKPFTILDSITCNMPDDRRLEYTDGTALVGWGAFVPKAIAFGALIRYRRHFEVDAIARREADRIVTGLSRLELVDVPFEHCPWATGPGRMCTRAGDPDHAAARIKIRARIEAVRTAEGIMKPGPKTCRRCGGQKTVGFDGPSLRIACPECCR